MAHRIAYKPTGIYLSSQIGDIPIWVDGTSVDVRLTAPGLVLLLDERYYAYSGNVTLYDLASLIENHLRSSGTPGGDFVLTVGNGSTIHDTAVLHILYCDRYTVCTDVDVFLRENFLTTLNYRRIAPDDTLSLFLYAKNGEQLDYNIAVRWQSPAYADGNPQLYRGTLGNPQTVTVDSVKQVNVSLTALRRTLASTYSVKYHSIEILSYTLSAGQRSITVCVDPSLKTNDGLLFRNCFNVWDYLSVPMVTTAKTDVERSTAVVNTLSSFYNQRVTKTYEVEAGPLTSDEAEWIDQLFTSCAVMRYEPNDCDETEPLIIANILVADSTCEVNDNPEKPITVKFTWRYEDNRPLVRLTASPGIFTSPYNLPFS